MRNGAPRVKVLLVLGLFLFVPLANFANGSEGSALDGRVWGDFTTPHPGPARSIGTVSAGCLQGSESLPVSGEGYELMRLSRRRTYGHPELIRFLKDLGRTALKDGVGTLFFGDLGLVRGGWMKSGHASHQSGLDVDIWFHHHPGKKRPQLSLQDREELSATSLVPVKFSKKINRRHWSPRVQKLIELAATDPRVDRVFVNAAIKHALCVARPKAAWLRKVRPWYAHDDHLHVRLACPVDSPQCKRQEPVPSGTGCDASLKWWFTNDAREEARKLALKAREKKDPPPITEDCLPLARDQSLATTPR
jgi:penicillin-insensitive murein endopeptidase